MTEEQIKVEALLVVAERSLNEAYGFVAILREDNRNDKLHAYRLNSERAAAHLEASVAALLTAHRICAHRAGVVLLQTGGAI